MNGKKLQRALFFLAIFIREATLIRESRGGSEQAVLEYYMEHISREDIGGDGWESYSTDYLRHVLPAKLVESKYSAIKNLRDDFERLREGAVRKNDEYKETIEGYRKELEKLASDYNFVGLSEAFSQLLKKKSSEKFKSLMAAAVLALFVVVLPIFLLISSQESVLELLFLLVGPL